MINIVIAGIGGQHLHTASQMLCVLSSLRNWDVVSNDEFGFAEMCAASNSHVRIANRGEDIKSPKVTRGTADLLLAFDPIEAARSLPYLSRSGQIVTATSIIQPTSLSLEGEQLTTNDVINHLKQALNSAMVREIKNDAVRASQRARLFIVNDQGLAKRKKSNPSIVPTMLIAQAIRAGCLPFTKGELAHAIGTCAAPEQRKQCMDVVNKLIRQ